MYGKRDIRVDICTCSFQTKPGVSIPSYMCMYAPILCFRTLFHEEISTFINLSAVELHHTFQRFSMDII